MNPRERRMAILLGTFIVLGGGGFFAYQFVYSPWRQQEQAKALLENDILSKKREILGITKDLPKLASWRLLALPADVAVAKREYGAYLKRLMDLCDWEIVNFPQGQAEVKEGPKLPNKTPIYTALTFTIQANASQAGIVQFLEEFAKTPLTHKIKSLTVEKPQRLVTGGDGEDKKGPGGPPNMGKGPFPNMGKGQFPMGGKGGKGGPMGKGKGRFGEQLPVNLKVEALIVTGPDKHWTSLRDLDDRLVAADLVAGLCVVPIGLAQVPWAVSPSGLRPPQVLAKTSSPRIYSEIARARLFDGAEEPKGSGRFAEDYDDVKQFVRLYMITWDPRFKRWEAKLYNRLTDRDIRLRDDNSGFKQFVIRDDDENVIVRGTVLKVVDRDVYFFANGEIFAIHNGESLSDAMWQAVPPQEAKRLGLIAESK
jgi:hypothetical protein